jgi:hypothetical protein
MKNKNWIGSGLLCGSLLAFAGCATPPPPKISPPPQLAPLKLYWDGRDNYTTATGAGERNAKNHGYSFVRVEGYVFASPQPGTVALQQYWSARRHDHWLLARNIPANVEKNGAYKFQRIEGYVYTNAQPGTVELKLFSRVRGDNFTFTTAQAETDARTAGYARRRLFRAYVLPPAEISGVTTQMFNGAVIMSDKGIVLQGDDRLNTPNTFRPPVEITIVAKTDSTNLRLAYAADQVIFNWEVDRNQLRVDGGPASGQHKAGAGSIPAGQFVTIRWLVTPSHQAIYVDDGLRFEHTGDYSNINRCVSVFPAGGSKAHERNHLSAQPARNDGRLASYLPRYIDKIRLHLAGKLHADYQENLGKGLTACGSRPPASRMSNLSGREKFHHRRRGLRLGAAKREEIRGRKGRALAGCLEPPEGRRRSAVARLKMRKEQAGIGHRDDIKCFVDMLDADEKRI